MQIDQKPYILHIGAAKQHLNCIRWLKEVGYKVMVTDKDTNAPGRFIADDFRCVDAQDKNQILKIAAKITEKEKLSGVFVHGEYALDSAAAVNEMFNLNGVNTSVLSKITDKFFAKKIWLANNISTPKGLKINYFASSNKQLSSLSFPLVIKPVSEWGGVGIHVVRNITELANVLKKTNAPQIVEEYITGVNLTVSGFFIDKKYYPCSISEYVYDQNTFQIKRIINPAPIDIADWQKAHQLLEDASRTIGYDNGPVAANIIQNNSSQYILELVPLFPPDVRDIVPIANGTNPVKAFHTLLQGKPKCNVFLNPLWESTVGWVAIYAKYGTKKFNNISGIGLALQAQEVIDVVIIREQGENLDDGRRRIGSIIALTKQKNELIKVLETALKKIEVF